MMRKFVRIASKFLIALALVLLALIAVGPWVIGAAGGSGAGIVGFGLLIYGAVFGVPAVIALLALGGIGMLFSGSRT